MKSTIALLALFGSQLASADAVLTYTGQAFNKTGAGAGSLTATFKFSSPLTASTTLTAADVASFSITSAGRTITSADAYTFSDFGFVLGADSLPTSWHIEVEKNIEGDSSKPEQWTSHFGTAGYSNYDAFGVDDNYANNRLANTASYSIIYTTPGTWAVAAAVPEPSSLALLAVGAAALFIARRRTTNQA